MKTIACTAAWACLIAAAPVSLTSTLTNAMAEGCTAIGTGQRCERRIESTTVSPDGTRWVTGVTGDWSNEGSEAPSAPAPRRAKPKHGSDVPAIRSKSVQAPGVSIDASGVHAPGVSIEWGN